MIEDERAIRDAVVVALRAAGYVVDAAADGDRAAATVDAFRPDLVILDVMLPTTGGFTLARSLRRIADLPIIVLTARDAARDRLTALPPAAMTM